VKPYIFSKQKLKDLGTELSLVKQSLYDTVKNLQDNNHLPVALKQEDYYHLTHSSQLEVSIWPLAHGPALAHSSLSPLLGVPKKAPVPKGPLSSGLGLGLRWVRPPK